MRTFSLLAAKRLAIALLTSLLFSAAALVRVRAGGAELAESLGEPLLAYAGTGRDEGLRTLLINGARLRLRTGSTPDSIDAVLDAQSEPCRLSSSWLEPRVRTRSADQGFVGCIVPRGGELLGDRLQVLAETHDLAALGELRATWAMQSAEGTRYVTLASAGALVVPEMFPAEGDAPGVDLPTLPRPPLARRLLSSWQEGESPALLSYRSELPFAVCDARYLQTLRSAGATVERAPGTRAEPRAWLVQHAEHAHLVLLAPDGAGTLISIIPLPDDATAREVAR